MILEKIIGSKAKVKILKALTKKEMQLSEICKSTEMSLSTIHSALKDMVKLRILSVRKVGNTKIYRINTSNYFARIAKEFVLKEEKFLDIVIKEFVKEAKKIKGVLSITLFGSALKLKELPVDIDILIIYNNNSSIKKNILKIEDKLLDKYDIHVSPIIFNKNEFIKKVKKNEKFIINIIAEGKCLYGKKLEEIAYGKRGK